MAFKIKKKENSTQKKLDKTSDIVAIVDGDYIAFKCAAVADDHYITVTHNKTGKKREFKNITEFKGRTRKTLGGWLGSINEKMIEKGKPEYTLEDFTIEEGVRLLRKEDKEGNKLSKEESLSHYFHSAKHMLESALEAINAKDYVLYIGGEETFRLDKSKLMKYKGNRDDISKPLLFKEVRQYMIDNLGAKVVDGIEVDDQVIIDAYKKDNHVVVAVDKDAMAQPVKVFNPDQDDLGIVDCSCLGELWLDKNKHCKGYGYKFMLVQLVLGDKADNYKPNYKSDVKFGDVAAYNLLKDIKSEKEGWKLVLEQYEKFYPESFKDKDWRGEDMTISWQSVLEEMFQMVCMQRFKDDDRDVWSELKKWKV